MCFFFSSDLFTSLKKQFSLLLFIFKQIDRSTIMNIYVGNLSREVSDEDLMTEFSAYGKVKSVKVIRDLFSGDSKGFGFVEMVVATEAQKAIDELNTKEVKGKKLVVNEARPKTDDRRGGSGGGSRGGFRGGSSSGGGNRGGGSGGFGGPRKRF